MLLPEEERLLPLLRTADEEPEERATEDVLREAAVLREGDALRETEAEREADALREMDETREEPALRKELLRVPDPKADVPLLRRRSP